MSVTTLPPTLPVGEPAAPPAVARHTTDGGAFDGTLAGLDRPAAGGTNPAGRGAPHPAAAHPSTEHPTPEQHPSAERRPTTERTHQRTARGRDQRDTPADTGTATANPAACPPATPTPGNPGGPADPGDPAATRGPAALTRADNLPADQAGADQAGADQAGADQAGADQAGADITAAAVPGAGVPSATGGTPDPASDQPATAASPAPVDVAPGTSRTDPGADPRRVQPPAGTTDGPDPTRPDPARPAGSDPTGPDSAPAGPATPDTATAPTGPARAGTGTASPAAARPASTAAATVGPSPTHGDTSGRDENRTGAAGTGRPAAQHSPATGGVDAAAAAAGPGAVTARVAAGAPSGPAAAPGSPVEQVVRVVAPLRELPGGQHAVTLRLSPDGLGTVSATVTVDANRLVVALSADTAHAREALRSGLNQLHEQLTHGSDLSCSVTLADAGTPERGSADTPPAPPRGTDSTRPDHPAPAADGPAPARPATLDRLLDIRL